MSPRRAVAGPAVLLAVAALLTGCGTRDAGRAAPSGTPSSSTPSSSTPSSSAPPGRPAAGMITAADLPGGGWVRRDDAARTTGLAPVGVPCQPLLDVLGPGFGGGRATPRRVAFTKDGDELRQDLVRTTRPRATDTLTQLDLALVQCSDFESGSGAHAVQIHSERLRDAARYGDDSIGYQVDIGQGASVTRYRLATVRQGGAVATVVDRYRAGADDTAFRAAVRAAARRLTSNGG
ncbi:MULTISPECIES: hypothetical protein [Streptomycetaceae]|uniref:PknH-like extracellular domain-containing protein n=1 Tax=Streptantibioticus cattleyicolor (strain ATCC 35852 / DSM 46488 / JCM 4925 / NBRC 14057 / NRRL 8057) TaxID=1003195 RepID=F8JP14_STREN|nr:MULTISPECIES: hypothetical protein [Streptomycetaceae]AEW93960.1 hypothetical protein SCATT_15890 [Streptantibioticus cattleyicolor NRRL 8057 = DSM 46488]MYS58632.1 hypothetical protein [Streptomyces sp. SID5468]CCB74302.1 exported protein of unknown function [Streptantibioticus cattleyicolor NRRL 8057 = DSM 46488]